MYFLEHPDCSVRNGLTRRVRSGRVCPGWCFVGGARRLGVEFVSEGLPSVPAARLEPMVLVALPPGFPVAKYRSDLMDLPDSDTNLRATCHALDEPVQDSQKGRLRVVGQDLGH